MSAPLHSKLNPSGAHRWVACTASVAFIEANARILPKDGGVFADEGTRAHSLATEVLTTNSQCLTPASPDFEMNMHVMAYVAFIHKNQKKGDRLLIERRVPLFYRQEDYGTVDAALIGNGRIFIADLKYGAGVGVQAEQNKQLAIYALSLIRELEVVEDVPDDTEVSLNIFQPRDRNDSEPIRNWTLTYGELKKFGDYIQQAVFDIGAGKTAFKADPDNQCRFCPAKGICKHYASYGLSVVTDEPIEVFPSKALELPEAASLSREQRLRIIAVKDAVEGWLKAVEAQEVTELSNGAEPIAFKLVTGKSNRAWVDEKAADQLLSNYLPAAVRRPPSDLISVAQAEKALKGIKTSPKFDNSFKRAWSKPLGDPTLVPIGDKRPALVFNAAAGLEDIDVI